MIAKKKGLLSEDKKPIHMVPANSRRVWEKIDEERRDNRPLRSEKKQS